MEKFNISEVEGKTEHFRINANYFRLPESEKLKSLNILKEWVSNEWEKLTSSNNGMSNESKQLFTEWNLACGRLRLLSSFVQNDFDRMLQDGYVTKEDIKKSIPEFNELYSKAITQIFELKTEIEKVLNEYAE